MFKTLLYTSSTMMCAPFLSAIILSGHALYESMKEEPEEAERRERIQERAVALKAKLETLQNNLAQQ